MATDDANCYSTVMTVSFRVSLEFSVITVALRSSKPVAFILKESFANCAGRRETLGKYTLCKRAVSVLQLTKTGASADDGLEEL
jgi:hypothetical protein